MTQVGWNFETPFIISVIVLFNEGLFYLIKAAESESELKW